MATNLLLEGDDLEALLIKAHSEGGPNARIVRADKYRHGGLWGFFARERFEVAVEIPEREPAGDADLAFFRPDVAYRPRRLGHGPDAEPAGTLSGSGEPPDREGDAARPEPAPAVRADVASVAAPELAAAAYQAAVGHDIGYDAGAGHRLPLPRTVGTGPASAPSRDHPALRLVDPYSEPDRRLDRPTGPASHGATSGTPSDAASAAPAAGPAATSGLLGLADRVSAAERAAARAVELMRAATPTIGPPSVALPRTDLVGATLASLAAGDPRGARPLTAPRPAAVAGPGGRGASVQRPVSPERSRLTGAPASPAEDRARTPGPTPGVPAGRRPITDPLDLLRAAVAQEDDVPHEPSHDPVRPSTSRPEFTALLDQLRDGARPGRAAEQAAAYRDVGLLPNDAGADAWGRERQPAGPPVPLPRPGTPAADAPAPADAPGPPTGSDALAADVRTADPRTAADRAVLRSYGVPAAWTRRLRSGDRFGEVLRMLERMPDPDVDPDAPVVAIVGPAAAVRLEAHRTAVELAVSGRPRPVVVVPATVGTERASAIARSLRIGPVVLAVEADPHDVGLVLDTLTTVQADAVIAIVEAAEPLEHTQRWLDALGQVDAVVLEGGSSVPSPASVLQLGVPVVRFDGIPLDRVTWTALLCAQLLAVDAAQTNVSGPYPAAE